MISVTHETTINASLGTIEKWFQEELIRNYSKIHPKDHKELRLLSDKPMRKGSLLFAKESIGNSFDLRMKIRLIEISMTGFAFECLFPYTLIGVKGKFTFHPIEKDTTEMIAENYIGHNIFGVSKIVDWIAKKIISPAAIQKHMKKEDEGIKRAIEHRNAATTNIAQ
jgi:hypothetical protein